MSTRYGMGDVDLTPDEQATFDAMLKGGEPAAPQPDIQPDTPAENTPATSAEPAEKTGQTTGQQPDKQPDDPDDPGTVTVDEQGRIRDSKGKFVPHGAFHSERSRRKSAESERDALRTEKAQLSERLSLLMQAYGIEEKGGAATAAVTPKAPPAVERPKPVPVEEDPLGAMKQLQELLFNAQQQGENPDVKKVQEELAQIKRAQAEDAVGRRFQADIAAARQSDPDFEPAFNHIVEVRAKVLKTQFPNATEAQVNQQVRQEIRNAVIMEYQNNRNPTALVKNFATAYGFQPKANGQASGQPGAPNGASGQPDPVTQKIENINRGQRAAASLSGIAGQSGDVVETARQLAALGEDEYAQARGKMSQREYERRYLGRE